MKRFLVAWVVVFVLWMLGGFVVHGAWLGKEYAKLGDLFRQPDGQQRFFHYLVLAHIVMAGSFVWIYGHGVTTRSFLGQGLRYGIAVALMTAVPTYLIYYAVQPLPRALVVRQIIGDSIVVLILGIVVAWVYRRGTVTEI
jgi:hypothetical protein